MEIASKLALKLLALFLIAQLIGFYTGFIIVKDFYKNPYIRSLIITPEPDNVANSFSFFIYIIISAVVLLFLIRFIKLEFIFTIMEILMISSASSIVFYALLRFVFDYELSILGGTLLGLSLAAIKFFYPKIKNLATILATAGVGVIFGISFGVTPTILFLLLLSFYDYIAVFITKHMVSMADFFIKKDLAFTITARETIPPSKPGLKPEEKRIDLGSGDMVAPIMFEVSLLSVNMVASLFVFIGALISFGLFIFLVFKKKMVLPALPPIVLGMIVFYALGLLLRIY